MSFDTNSYPQLYSSPASQILTQHVYDRYPTTMPAALAFEEIPDMTCDLTGIEPETLLDTSTTGLPTYEKLAAITDSSIGGEYHRAFYYDYKGREIQRVECDFDTNFTSWLNTDCFVAGLYSPQSEVSTFSSSIKVPPSK